MAGVISIALKAVDQYSGVLTGLNQGFELVGKAIGALKSVASTAFEAITKGVNLARIGGAFDEQRNQFENLARSYGLVGQEIVDIVKKTSANTITEFDSITIATKAVAAGLRGPDLENALAYIKRWSEATGESFQSAAEKVFTSLSSGRFSVLRQMGLVIENGAKLNDVTAAISVGLTKFGETGFNTADKLAALTASQDDFTRKVGQAINRVPIFQEILGGFSDAVVLLVQSFDPRPLSVFFDVFGKLFINLVKSAAAAIPGLDSVFKFIGDILNGTADDASSVVLSISRSLFGITRTVATVANDVLDILTDTGILTFVEFLMSTIISTISIGGKIIFATVGNIAAGVISAFEIAITGISELVRSSPTLSEWLGIDPQDLAGVEVALMKASKGVENFTSKIVDGFDVGQEFADNLNAGLAESLRRGRFDLAAIDDAESEMVDRISNIDFSKQWGESLTPDKETFMDGLKKTIDEVEKIAGEGIGKIEIPADLGISGKIASEFESGIADAEKLVQKSAKQIALDLAPDDKMRSIADYVLEKVGATNWPTAMQQMMQAMLAMLVAAVVDEPMPIAITNFRPV